MLPATTTGHTVDNQHPAGAGHHLTLCEQLDRATTHRLNQLGEWAAAQCLELGAGAGGVAVWLADLVDLFGRVTAVDLDTTQLPIHPRLHSLRYDLRRGMGRLPPGPYDLIHARLLFAHLPNRDTLLADLAALLAPGGTILIEDWAPLRTRDEIIIAAPSDDAAARYLECHEALGQVLDVAGTDRTWARRIHPTMLAAGLTDVHTEVRAEFWTGGGPGCRAMAVALNQARPTLRAVMAEDRIDAVLDLLDDPRLVLHSHPMYATSGRAAH